MYEHLNSLKTATAPSAPSALPVASQGTHLATAYRRPLAQRQEQFADLATSVADVLYTAALRWSGNHAHAEDLVQETHLRAWRNFDRFTIGTCFRAWVLQILRFVFSNRRRCAASHQVTMDFQTDEFLLDARPQQLKGLEPRDADWESVFPDLVDDTLKHALDCLPPTQRTLALRIPLGGLSYQECADELGIPIGTVMSRYARAKDKLKRELRWAPVNGVRRRNSTSP
jgi:RNA polymerase sigma-70 factor (ECF subfamily)